jgi:hypothetical protein
MAAAIPKSINKGCRVFHVTEPEILECPIFHILLVKAKERDKWMGVVTKMHYKKGMQDEEIILENNLLS